MIRSKGSHLRARPASNRTLSRYSDGSPCHVWLTPLFDSTIRGFRLSRPKKCPAGRLHEVGARDEVCRGSVPTPSACVKPRRAVPESAKSGPAGHARQCWDSSVADRRRTDAPPELGANEHVQDRCGLGSGLSRAGPCVRHRCRRFSGRGCGRDRARARPAPRAGCGIRGLGLCSALFPLWGGRGVAGIVTVQRRGQAGSRQSQLLGLAGETRPGPVHHQVREIGRCDQSR